MDKIMLNNYKLLLFDLDGTLLNSKKEITERTARTIAQCKAAGIKIGICTSRSEYNALSFVSMIHPDVVISSGGALVKADGEFILRNEFSISETKEVIRKIRTILGEDCEISVDTIDGNYWNYKINPNTTENNWGESIYADFRDTDFSALKICAEIIDGSKEQSFYDAFAVYDCLKFSDGNWYKITKKNISKETAIQAVVRHYNILLQEVMAFGDDVADIGMLKLCGTGVAMGNSFAGVKEAADIVIGDNDQDGIAEFLEKYFEPEK